MKGILIFETTVKIDIQNEKRDNENKHVVDFHPFANLCITKIK
jgi:hypothetical protein